MTSARPDDIDSRVRESRIREPRIQESRIRAIVHDARSNGRALLLESEGFAVLRAMGIASPIARTLPYDTDIDTTPDTTTDATPDATTDDLDLSVFPGDKLVLKVMSSEIAHKSDVGGVRVIERQAPALREALASMRADLSNHVPEAQVQGFSVQAFVPEAAQFGREALLGVRWSEDFGPVLVFGPGGLFAEVLANRWLPESGLLMLSCDDLLARQDLDQDQDQNQDQNQDLDDILRANPWVTLLTERFRGRQPVTTLATLRALLERLARVAVACMPETIAELEINPLVFSAHGPVAVDVLIRPAPTTPAPTTLAPTIGRPLVPPRPLHKIERLLEPRTIALIGVSRDATRPGHILLSNLLDAGFARERIIIVKPGTESGTESIRGCRCVPDVASLPETVDLTVLSVSAGRVPGFVEALLQGQKTQSILLITSGLGQPYPADQATGDHATGTTATPMTPITTVRQHIRGMLARARTDAWQGPVLNGGNCVGIRAMPARVDALFIPAHKMAPPTDNAAPVALLLQSGALMIAMLERWIGDSPRYAVSLGDQDDLTLADHLEYLLRHDIRDPDRGVATIAIYLEGFQPLDGRRFLQATRQHTRAGRTVLIYRSGRTREGARASASHTASVAGDYRVFAALAAHAGAIVAETLDDFRDLLLLSRYLHDKPVRGYRLAAMSNAGFECVTFADQLGCFTLAEFSPATRDALGALLRAARLDTLCDVRNPLDTSPMLDDARFADAARLVVGGVGGDGDHACHAGHAGHANVDVAIIGCVPMTGALQTLAAGPGHHEDIESPDSVVQRLIKLHHESTTPWILVVDSGPRYQAMRARLRAAGVPTFSSADRALRLLQLAARTSLARAAARD